MSKLASDVLLASALLGVHLSVGAANEPCKDLTGVWQANDTGIYYMSQEGHKFFWYGESDEIMPAWSNVFYGVRAAKTITGFWADVPKGVNNFNGTLGLKVSTDCQTIERTSASGGFSGSLWVRQ